MKKITIIQALILNLILFGSAIAQEINSGKNRIDMIDSLIDAKLAVEDIDQEITRDTIYRRKQISVFPFVGTNGSQSGDAINEYSFNVIGGYSMGTSKFEMAGLFNIDRTNVSGVQLAGHFNYVGGNVSGFQAAGMANIVMQKSNAFQLAGYANVVLDSATQPQFAGIMNADLGYSRGVHLASMANLHFGHYEGAAISGMINANFRKSQGTMLAGMSNFQFGDFKGFQGSGMANFTFGTMEGVQLAGLLNVAGKVNGAQIGTFNVADSVQGIQVGFMSFSRTGYHKIEVSGDEIFYANLAFRTGSSHAFYNIFTAGIDPQEVDDPYWTYGYGIGTSPKLTKWLYLNLDLTANKVNHGDYVEDLSLLTRLNLGLEIQPFKKISLAGAITLNSYLTDINQNDSPNLFTHNRQHLIVNDNYDAKVNHKMWLGWKVSLRFL